MPTIPSCRGADCLLPAGEAVYWGGAADNFFRRSPSFEKAPERALAEPVAHVSSATRPRGSCSSLPCGAVYSGAAADNFVKVVEEEAARALANQVAKSSSATLLCTSNQFVDNMGGNRTPFPFSRGEVVIVRLLCVSWTCIVCAAFLAWAPLALAQPDQSITPEQAKDMIIRFIKSEEGAKFKCRDISDSKGRLHIDSRTGLIRFHQWQVDPVKRTVALPRQKTELRASFGKDGDRFVIKDAREVRVVSGIEPKEAKAMILRFLSSAEGAKLPSWVADSRTGVEASGPAFHRYCVDSRIDVGHWSVYPERGTVLLPTDRAKLTGKIGIDGDDYDIKHVAVAEVRRITPPEAKAMILRFLASGQAAEVRRELPTLRETVESASPSVWEDGSIAVGPWTIYPMREEVRLIESPFFERFGVFVKEGEAYSIRLNSALEHYIRLK
jgi:hypothetical protein